MKNFILRLKKYFNNKLIIKKFKKYNKNHFFKIKSNKIILVEFNAFFSSHFFLALIANFLSKKNSCSIVAYYNYYLISSDVNSSILNKIKWHIGKRINAGFFGIYNSFGVADFIKPDFSKNNKKAEVLFNEIEKKIKTKNDILEIKINDIPIGDLLYDGFLRYNLNYTKNFTIDIESKKFKEYLHNFIKLFLFWEEYLKTNQILAVIGVICYYSQGLILRISSSNNKIITLAVEGGQLYKLSKSRNVSHLEFKDYKNLFANLSNEEQNQYKEKSYQSIKNRFSGMVKNYIYTTTSSFSEVYNKDVEVLKKNSKIKILISSHNIGDVSSAFGKNFFPDFYEWLNFLGQMSEKTDYDWYIKDHPYYSDLKYSTTQQKSYRLSEMLVNKYNKIKRIPPNTSHHQLINEGINFVLTVYGTIAWEYAYHEIPVLTATRNCRTINYDFNVHSKNKDDYEKNILNLKNISFNSKKNEIIEYYSMNYLFFNHDAIFKNYSDFVKDPKYNWDSYDTPEFYKFLTNNVDDFEMNEINKKLERFLNSGDYHLSRIHAK